MVRAKSSHKWDRFMRVGTRIGGISQAPHFLLAAILAVALAGCTEDAKPSAPSAASVNGQEISVSEVSDALERFEATDQFDQLAEQSDRDAARLQYQRMYLGEQIKRLVLRARADALGIDIGDEVADRVEEARSAYPSEKEFAQALKAGGFTVAEYSEMLKDQVLEEKLREEVTADVAAESEPSMKELKQSYRSNRESYQQTEVQHILVKDMALARELSTELASAAPEARSTLLAELARKHSIDPSNADKGGELGWVSGDEFVEPFVAAMDKLDIGEVSGPVRSDFGIHVILVTGRRQQSFEDVKGEIAQQFKDMAVGQAWSEWLQSAYKQADIELNPRYGKLDPFSGQIVDASAEDVPSASEDSPASG
jgi:parvulin-like peptidyl-prolyl isomerase